MSVFSDEWRACLREQYKHVIRANDVVTRTSLTDVMIQVGFGEDELAQLRLEATLRVEDVPEDFVPDLDILRQQEVTPTDEMKEFQAHPLECQCPACVEMNIVLHDEEGLPVNMDEMDPEEIAELIEEDPDFDEPQQLSLF
jgi:hypothetical protein